MALKDTTIELQAMHIPETPFELYTCIAQIEASDLYLVRKRERLRLFVMTKQDAVSAIKQPIESSTRLLSPSAPLVLMERRSSHPLESLPLPAAGRLLMSN